MPRMPKHIGKSNPLANYIGMRLWTLRESKGLRIVDMADSVGLSYNTIWNIENGKANTNVLTLYELAKALNININYFFEGFPG